MPLPSFYSLVNDKLAVVDEVIQAQFHSKTDLINEIGLHIFQKKGKRLRPLLVLLGAGLFDCLNGDSISLAAVVELIHTTTLLHDDVVDASTLRRGKKTANIVWGNEASVLVGDYLYSRAFHLMVELNNFKILKLFSDATPHIAEGEVLQLQNRHNPDLDEENYLQIIQYKTGILFSIAAQLGALLAEKSAAEIQAMLNYGMHLGTAFQMVDDTLDYIAKTETTGKNLGDDLAEGKTTLPLIYAMKKCDGEEKARLRDALIHGKKEEFQFIVKMIESTHAIDYVLLSAKQEIQKALQALTIFPASVYREALTELAWFTVERRA
ncbi:MAG: hypothetical protein ACD_44C00481G0009 [uncultured bacterium]|nr:MAG: hypothetical protein ACD_44C00481G0009 [uncultured bacterium]